MNLGKETETLEFKKTTGEMKEAMVSISSILNKHGIGTLYFGVKPSGDVIGQEVSESSLRDVSRAVYENIRPQIYPAIEKPRCKNCGIFITQKPGVKKKLFCSDNAGCPGGMAILSLWREKRSALSSVRIVERNSLFMEAKYGNSVRITATSKNAMEQEAPNSDI